MAEIIRANSEKTGGTVTLDYIVKNIKNREQVFNQTDYLHILQLVIDATSYLNNITIDTIEVAYITLGDSSCIDLPNDYLDYTKIGFLDCNNKLWTLTLNSNLIRKPNIECGLPLDKVVGGFCEIYPTTYTYPDSGYYFGNGFHWGNTMSVYYGLGGGFNRGYYNIDRQGRYLLIQGLPKGTTIVLEYKSTGVSIGATTYVTRQALEAIIAKVMWTRYEYSENYNAAIYWKSRFIEEEALLQNLEYTRTAEEHLDELYRIWNQGAKR